MSASHGCAASTGVVSPPVEEIAARSDGLSLGASLDGIALGAGALGLAVAGHPDDSAVGIALSGVDDPR